MSAAMATGCKCVLSKDVMHGRGVFTEVTDSRAKINNLNTMNPQKGTVAFWIKTSPGFPGDILNQSDVTWFTMEIAHGLPGAQQGALDGILQIGAPPTPFFRWVGTLQFPNYLWDVALDIPALSWGPNEVHHLAFTYNPAEPTQAAKIFV